MLLCNRRHFLLGLTALGGCGFEPILGNNGPAENLRGAILVDRPTDRNSFNLVEQLEQRLGRASGPRFGLAVALDLTEEGLAISGSNDITRYNVVGVAGYTLYSLSSGEFLLQGKVDSFTSYSASQQPVATQAAERDARARLMIALADKISAKLLIAARRF